jgi:radical SAM/Cys-rich protein
MSRQTADRVLTLLSRSEQPRIVDVTGGAPELNPSFRHLVEQCRMRDLHVIDRCNLTILLELGFEHLADFLAGNRVEITASLPCYTRENVDRQRGRGVFNKSIQALRLLNKIGYGVSDELPLNLVYNPLGPSLPPPQEALEADYKRHLLVDFGIRFNRLFTITNMPISRFAEFLIRNGTLETYSKLLAGNFNPATVDHVMCRSLISVGWDGKLYDCDFNQMLDISIPPRLTIWNIDTFDALANQHIATASHCFGCTAGAGSSCGGKLA